MPERWRAPAGEPMADKSFGNTELTCQQSGPAIPGSRPGYQVANEFFFRIHLKGAGLHTVYV